MLDILYTQKSFTITQNIKEDIGNPISSYLFVDNEKFQIDVFLPESFDITNLRHRLKDISPNCFDILRKILKNEKILSNDKIYLNDTGYIHVITKIFDNYLLNINILPKFVNAFLPEGKNLDYSYLKNLNKFLINLNLILNSYSANNKNSLIFNSSKDDNLNLIEFEHDLFILRKIYNLITKDLLVHKPLTMNVFSDMPIGIINQELLKYNIDKSITPQIVTIKDNSLLYSFIYSCIFNKYNHKLTSILKANKHNNILKSLLSYLKKIKQLDVFTDLDLINFNQIEIKKTFFTNDSFLISNPKLKSYLKSFVANSIYTDKSFDYQKKTLKIFYIFEKFIEKNLSLSLPENTQISFQGSNKIDTIKQNMVNFTYHKPSANSLHSYSKIDVIWQDSLQYNGKTLNYFNVADAKYKNLDATQTPDTSDIDKIMRDLLLHNKLNSRFESDEIDKNEYFMLRKQIKAYLLYPAKIDLDITLNLNSVKEFNGLNLISDIKTVNFTNNNEYSGVNILYKEIPFVEIS